MQVDAGPPAGGRSGAVSRTGARRAAAVARTALLVALPWAWFGLRDVLGVVGDLFAIVLPVAAVVVAVVLVAALRRRGALPAVSVLLAGTVAVVGPWVPADAGAVAPGRAVTVAGANVTASPGAVPALRAVGADVLVVAEDAVVVHRRVARAYPFDVYATRSPAVGVFSRFPLRSVEGPDPGLPGLRLVVDAPTPFVLYALHVPKPWWPDGSGYHATPAEHHRIVADLAARVARERDPVVLVGDLNSTDRGRDLRTLTAGVGLTDAMRDGWAGPTSVTTWRALLLRIDHLLVGPGWCGDAARRFALPGSDHDGVTATVGPCA